MMDHPLPKEDVCIHCSESFSHNLPFFMVPEEDNARGDDKDVVDVVVGIDEAGRGPVLGPMVYALFVSPVVAEPTLRPLGVQDSKALTAGGREQLFRQLSADGQFGYSVRVISPREISTCMMQRGINLNELSYAVVYDLLDQLVRHSGSLLAGASDLVAHKSTERPKTLRVCGVFVDTLGPPDKYRQRLEQRYPQWPFRVQPRADVDHAVVGAASIVAKVVRDDRLRTFPLPERIDRDFGSGYPSDPLTVGWLRRHAHPLHGFPDIVRFSWASAERILQEKRYRAFFSPSLLTPRQHPGMPPTTVIKRGFLQHVNLSFLARNMH
jgi:ribonuclease H2 subunit A